jgi:hypothetical protein
MPELDSRKKTIKFQLAAYILQIGLLKAAAEGYLHCQ